MVKKLSPSSFYFELYDRIYITCNRCHILNRREAEKIIGRAYNIPEILRKYIIKEMELAGWIRPYKRRDIELIHPPFNLKDCPSNISKHLDLW